MRRVFVIASGLVAGAAYLGNASWLAEPIGTEASIMAHRGVHQTFSRDNLTNETCTAERIFPPTHGFIENTVPSIQAAIDLGAEWIEIDIHPTTDGEFVVFHDWTLECRTDGAGRVRDHDLAALKALDIGYGYTADGGMTYPFRGQFTGSMPSLSEVLMRFPDVNFMINIKSRSKDEARKLLAYIHPDDWRRLGVTAHQDPVSVIEEAGVGALTMSRQKAKSCLKSYVALGWSGYMPDACKATLVPVPQNYTALVWGWPHRFERRLQSVGSRSMILGPLDGGRTSGIDAHEQLSKLPKNYASIIFTDKIEVIADEALPR